MRAGPLSGGKRVIKKSRGKHNQLTHLYGADVAYVLHVSVGCRIKSHVFSSHLQRHTLVTGCSARPSMLSMQSMS